MTYLTSDDHSASRRDVLVESGVRAEQRVAVPRPLTVLWDNAAALAATASVSSAWLPVAHLDELTVTRSADGGVYALGIEWSVDGATAAFAYDVTVPGDTPTTVAVAAPYVRLTVRNDDATVAFTAHRTVTCGR